VSDPETRPDGAPAIDPVRRVPRTWPMNAGARRRDRIRIAGTSLLRRGPRVDGEIRRDGQGYCAGFPARRRAGPVGREYGKATTIRLVRCRYRSDRFYERNGTLRFHPHLTRERAAIMVKEACLLS
jgi:hypothetical protein